MTKRALLLLSLMALAWMGVFALDVRDFGAKGDGIADDTDAIQRALDVAETYEAKFLAGRSEIPAWDGHGGHGSSGLSAMGPDVLCIEQSEFLCDKDTPLSILRTTSKPGYVNSVIRAIDSKFRLGESRC